MRACIDRERKATRLRQGFLENNTHIVDLLASVLRTVERLHAQQVEGLDGAKEVAVVAHAKVPALGGAGEGGLTEHQHESIAAALAVLKGQREEQAATAVP